MFQKVSSHVNLVFPTSSGEMWSGWGGEWPPTQAGMGWGWGWPVDSYSQGGASGGPDIGPHQYNSNNVSQSLYNSSCSDDITIMSYH